MAYHFNGVFIAPCPVAQSEAAALFDGFGRTIVAPFAGVLVSFKNDWREKDDLTPLVQLVLERSQQLPDSRIVCLDYQCWGGDVDFCWGFACQNGQMLGGGELERENDENLAVLRELLGFLGAQLPESGFFAPFELGFFPNT